MMKIVKLAWLWSIFLCVGLAGCGSSESDLVGFPTTVAVGSTRTSVESEGAELQLDFNLPGGGSSLSPLVDRLIVSGFNQAGDKMFGPHILDRPSDDVLVLNMHSEVTLVEIEASNSLVSAQTTDAASTKTQIPVTLQKGRSHKVVVVVNRAGGLTPVVVPPQVPTLTVLPFTPSIPATFVAQGFGYLNGNFLAIDLNGKSAVEVGLEDDGSFTLGADTQDPDPDLSGTLFSSAGNLSSISASYSSQAVTLQLFTSTDGLRYQPYSDGVTIPIEPSQANNSGQTVIDFPFDLPMQPEIRYVWLCRPAQAGALEGTLSIATTVDLAPLNTQP